MRNHLIQILPPGTTLTVPVKPPLKPDEAPVVFTASGRQSVVVRIMDSETVALYNPTDESSTFLFFIHNQPTTTPAWLETAMRVIRGYR